MGVHAATGPADGGPIVVIGCGNALRRDDGLGPRAAEAVASWRLPGVEAMVVHQLSPELVERLSAARLAIFVDARLSDDAWAEGVRVAPIGPCERLASHGHAGRPDSLLAIAEVLFGRCPEAWSVSAPAADLDLGEGLSERAEAMLGEVLGRISGLIEAAGGGRCTRSP